MTNMLQYDGAPTGSREQRQPMEMAIDTTVHQFDDICKPSFGTAAVQDKPRTYLNAYTSSKDELLSQSLAISGFALETISETATIIYLLSTIQYSDFNTHLFDMQVTIIACWQKVFDGIYKMN